MLKEIRREIGAHARFLLWSKQTTSGLRDGAGEGRLHDDKPNHIRLEGEVPTPVNLPSGCVFHGRCPHANERCRREIPRLIAIEGGQVACHAVEEGRID